MSGTLRSALAEFIGTFLFVFAIISAVNDGSVFAPIAIGFALMVLVYATGHISGAHLNPAVSVGVWLRGAIGAKDMLVYIVAQLVGAALGAAVTFALFPTPKAPGKFELGPSFLVEALWTLVLVYVVLNVATSKDNANNSFYGLAIGSTVLVGAIAVGPISGGAFNPAVALGLSITGHFAWASFWVYVVAPIVGGAVAALLFRLLNTHDKLPLAVAAEESTAASA
ncbi:MIP/aquaporin family protein [Microbacterium sp. ASV49]|uniref:Aquaporin n=1 Tax=Microbacterium candidum TaxID=3041922 RepID=A0ABT7N0W5_9MICO|nr:aquaporin [Microbacterium sp. ASV49]MDL9980349.1 aquaporin [Microbacterium sp. ASV49]